MLAVPFLLVVASTRRGRLVLLTTLCVLVSALRSSFHPGDSPAAAPDANGASLYIAVGRLELADERTAEVGTVATYFWRHVDRFLQLRPRRLPPPPPIELPPELLAAHFSSLVSAEEVAQHHLRWSAHEISAPLPSSSSWSSRLVATASLLQQELRRRIGAGDRVVDVQTSSDATVMTDPNVAATKLLSKSTTAEMIPQEVVLHSLTEPLLRTDVWNALRGDEFRDHPEILEPLASRSEQLIRCEDNPWIDWRPYGASGSDDGEDDSDRIQLWTGRAKQVDNYVGAGVPFIKAQSRIPMSPMDLKDLLMDSTRIKSYNSWSTGRQDCWVAPAESSAPPAKSRRLPAQPPPSNQGIVTKIVKNTVKPPIGSTLVGVTLLHARPLAHGSWIVVSRSVGGNAYFDQQDLTSAGRSDILLGVNLLEPVPDDEDACIMTSITHASSTAVPSMLAERLGIKGAVKFVQDIRKLRVPV